MAWRRVPGSGPTILWLGGYRSDMTGTKAEALATWAREAGRDFLRFDFTGHGASEGRLRDGTISRWREDALAVLDDLTEGQVVLAGSSMGAWIALLVAMARPQRVRSLVLVAPAPDFTEKLIEPPPEARAALAREGVWMRPSEFGDPDPITRDLLEDGARWSVLGGEAIPIEAPVRILHGGQDTAAPWRHGLELANSLAGEDVVFVLVRDGDHRLSRPQDIARLVATVAEATAERA